MIKRAEKRRKMRKMTSRHEMMKTYRREGKRLALIASQFSSDEDEWTDGELDDSENEEVEKLFRKGRWWEKERAWRYR